MAQETNSYVHDMIRKVLQGRDPFEQMDHHNHRQHAWLGTWKDLNESDIKFFITHLLIMSSIKKSALHNYWSTNSLMRTPFFRTYLKRNKFQDILWNFQVADTKNNPSPGSLNQTLSSSRNVPNKLSPSVHTIQIHFFGRIYNGFQRTCQIFAI